VGTDAGDRAGGPPPGDHQARRCLNRSSIPTSSSAC
jgi:hypothetical protein